MLLRRAIYVATVILSKSERTRSGSEDAVEGPRRCGHSYAVRSSFTLSPELRFSFRKSNGTLQNGLVKTFRAVWIAGTSSGFFGPETALRMTDERVLRSDWRPATLGLCLSREQLIRYNQPYSCLNSATSLCRSLWTWCLPTRPASASR